MYKKHYPTLRNLSSSAAHKSSSKDDSNMSSKFFMSSIFNYGTNICNKYEIAKAFSIYFQNIFIFYFLIL